VDVGARGERLAEAIIAGEVGEDPQLDLRVVGGQDHLPCVARHERTPDLASELGPDRDVLQVGIGRGQPPGRRARLVERRVEPPVVGDLARQCLQIRRVQLVELSPR
jgi:hypothetical protein